ncbi:MAG: DUF4445 domain-containing protein [Anaerolineales bacterium]|nr:DUF4445 domain-containing protein [Anaerolineales bacterium]
MSFTIEFEPIGIRLLCEEPLSISEAARRAGIGLRSECGGKAVCGKCLVHMEPGAAGISYVSSPETSHIKAKQFAEGWRLACRTILKSDAKVFIPPTSQIENQIVQTEGVASFFQAHSPIQCLSIDISPPSLEKQQADFERISTTLERQLNIKGIWAGLPALRSLRMVLRQGNWQGTIALNDREIIAAFTEKNIQPLGLAVDVGTTKLACYLVNLETGQTLATSGIMNPQIVFGEDVMSRLEKVMVSSENADRLQRNVIESINQIASTLCETQSVTVDRLLAFCIVGNTAMHHLLLNLPVRPLALAPFIPALSSSLEVKADSLGLHAAPGAVVYLPPPIAGFVGSDHLAFLLACQFGEDTRIRLGIDIGTNSEIALQMNDRIVSCSTASGPAFEGAHIRHGMRAAVGAIAHVCIDENLHPHCDVIGHGLPMGICGSGILDAIAEMRRTNIINSRGRIDPQAAGVMIEQNSIPAYILAAGNNGRHDIVVAQQDIDQILMAKGAIRAGIEILMDHFHITTQDIEDVTIAGAFGSYLDPFNAVRIGLLPEIPLDHIHTVGNAAGTGARMILASTECRIQAEALARKIDYLELTVVPGFNRYFAKGIRLPSPQT